MSTNTAYTEYKKTIIPVAMRKQLAMDEPWHFAVGVVGPIERVFQLDKDDTNALENGEFDFVAEPSARYIVIRSNSTTYDDFQSIRGRNHVQLTRATVYLCALTSALGSLRKDGPDDNELDEGWAATVWSLIQEQDIQWPEPCTDGLAAQKLLRTPLDKLTILSELMQKGEG